VPCGRDFYSWIFCGCNMEIRDFGVPWSVMCACVMRVYRRVTWSGLALFLLIFFLTFIARLRVYMSCSLKISIVRYGSLLHVPL